MKRDRSIMTKAYKEYMVLEGVYRELIRNGMNPQDRVLDKIGGRQTKLYGGMTKEEFDAVMFEDNIYCS